MTHVLITGMSGTGKSTVIAALRARGFPAVDADEDGYSHLVAVTEDEPTGLAPGTDWVWREDRMEALLESPVDEVLFVGGCAPNQGRFRNRFGHVILLTLPAATMADRLRTRTTNPYGQDEADVARALEMKALVEPLLRASADLEIDTRVPLDEVVDAVLRQAGIAG
jgi:shikimate kinase